MGCVWASAVNEQHSVFAWPWLLHCQDDLDLSVQIHWQLDVGVGKNSLSIYWSVSLSTHWQFGMLNYGAWELLQVQRVISNLVVP